jgi:hypothetical protein
MRHQVVARYTHEVVGKIATTKRWWQEAELYSPRWWQDYVLGECPPSFYIAMYGASDNIQVSCLQGLTVNA